MSEVAGRELDWNDSIEKDVAEFVLLAEGEYDFVVESFERGRHAGSDKLPPCNKAMLKIRIKATEGTVNLNHNLFLHTITEGMLSAFFASIGQKKKGETLAMNWNLVPQAMGRCKLGIRTYVKDGETRKINEIKQFLPKEAKTFQAGKF